MRDELIMICYFQESLKPSIKIEMEQQDWESVSFEEMVQRAVNVEAKAGLRSTIMIQDLDIRCLWDHHPSNNTASKVQTQGTAAKDSSLLEELKTKDPKSISLHDKLAEPAKKENKQKKFKRQWERTREPKETPAIDNNTVDAAKKKKKRDTSKVTCFNCNKKGYYASNCTKPKN